MGERWIRPLPLMDAQPHVRVPERGFQPVGTQPENGQQLGLHLMVVGLQDVLPIEAGRLQEIRQRLSGGLETTPRIHQGIVEINQYEFWAFH